MKTKRMSFPSLLLVLVLIAIPLMGCGTSVKPPIALPTPIILAMEDCKVEGPPRFTADMSIFRLLVTGPPKEQLIKRSTVEVGGEKFNLYLPKAKAYSNVNAKPGDVLENTSTMIYVDHDGNGKLSSDEGRYADLPMRAGDQMFDVSEIAPDGSRLVLKPSASPPLGVIVGRSCPSFSFKTADGQVVNNDSVAGKTLILDVWSFT